MATVASRYLLRQGGYVIVVVGWSVCLLATLRKNFPTDLHEICREGRKRANEQTIKFWWRSGSRITDTLFTGPLSKIKTRTEAQRSQRNRATLHIFRKHFHRHPSTDTVETSPHDVSLSRSRSDVTPSLLVKAKFHHAIWSQTGSKLVADLQRAEIWPVI